MIRAGLVAEHSGEVILAVSMVVAAAALTGLFLLALPTSWLSRWVDRQVDAAVRLPADDTAAKP